MNVKVTNNSDRELGLPNGQYIQIGETALVKEWNKMESHPVVEAWVRAGALTLGDSDVSTDADDTGADGDSDADNSGNDGKDGEKPADPAPVNPFAKKK